MVSSNAIGKYELYGVRLQLLLAAKNNQEIHQYDIKNKCVLQIYFHRRHFELRLWKKSQVCLLTIIKVLSLQNYQNQLKCL